MLDSILVTYATRYGSTQEVAEAIVATLRERGLAVDMKPIREVRTLARYHAIVLGAPLFMYRWHKEALRFLPQHRDVLIALPVAIFAGGPIGAGDAAEWQMARDQLDKELAQFTWLKPVSIKIVGGKFDPAKIRFPMSLFTKQVPASDLRDWTAIRAWANELAARFDSAPA